jgi:hypothetical protein
LPEEKNIRVREFETNFRREYLEQRWKRNKAQNCIMDG